MENYYGMFMQMMYFPKMDNKWKKRFIEMTAIGLVLIGAGCAKAEGNTVTSEGVVCAGGKALNANEVSILPAWEGVNYDTVAVGEGRSDTSEYPLPSFLVHDSGIFIMREPYARIWNVDDMQPNEWYSPNNEEKAKITIETDWKGERVFDLWWQNKSRLHEELCIDKKFTSLEQKEKVNFYLRSVER